MPHSSCPGAAPTVGAPVGAERRPLGCAVHRGQISGHARPPERVDGLFRVADDHQRAVVLAENRGDDLPLGAVGVLELVHQCHVEHRPHRSAGGVAHVGVDEGIPCKEEQVVVGHQACLPAPAGHLGPNRDGKTRPDMGLAGGGGGIGDDAGVGVADDRPRDPLQVPGRHQVGRVS